MWLLKTGDSADRPFTFRILPGNIKTVGRAARADFVLDAGMVSRIHCRLTAGAQELEVIDTLDVAGNVFLGREPHWAGPLQLLDRKRMEADTVHQLARNRKRKANA